MTGFRVGIMDLNVVSRPTAESLTRAGYLNALANRVDSFWVPDHLNGLFPRSLWKQKYCGATKLMIAMMAKGYGNSMKWNEEVISRGPWCPTLSIGPRHRTCKCMVGSGLRSAEKR
jgi:hypothetical protein